MDLNWFLYLIHIAAICVAFYSLRVLVFDIMLGVAFGLFARDVDYHLSLRHWTWYLHAFSAFLTHCRESFFACTTFVGPKKFKACQRNARRRSRINNPLRKRNHTIIWEVGTRWFNHFIKYTAI